MLTEKIVNVLYLDDEVNSLEAFKASFRRYYNIFTAGSAEEARKILEQNTIHVLITDQKMPDTPGITLLEEAVEQFPAQMRILLTAFPDLEALAYARSQGLIFGYLMKPWNFEDLKETIEDAYMIYMKIAGYEAARTAAAEKLILLEEKLRRMQNDDK